MAITKRPTIFSTKPMPVSRNSRSSAGDMSDEAFERVMRGAIDYNPDPSPTDPLPNGVMNGDNCRIAIVIKPEILTKLDALAQNQHLTRAEIIMMALSEHLKRSCRDY